MHTTKFPDLNALSKSRSWSDSFLRKAIQRYEPDLNSGCWIWSGAMDGKGYGVVFYEKKPHRAHRVLYSVLRGRIPSGLVLRHKCDVKSCVNPDHLIPGTQSENMQDAYDRGQKTPLGFRGESNGNVKMSEETAVGIRSKLQAGWRTKDIIRQYGVTRHQVNHIKTGKNWSHI